MPRRATPGTSSRSWARSCPTASRRTSASSPTPAASTRTLCRRGARGAAGVGLGGRARVALVTGDDIMHRLEQLVEQGHELRNMDTGAPLSDVLSRIQSANAYIGARPIVEALDRGAHVVITGRSTDTALTYAPMIHAFGWAADAWDQLAAGMVAGHINECGAQASGGNSLIAWKELTDLGDVGYPIIEAYADGSLRRHEARWHRRSRFRTRRCRTDPLRDGRSAHLHHARRGGGLHDDPASRRGRRPRARARRARPAARTC
jgi:hypothetical protein